MSSIASLVHYPGECRDPQVSLGDAEGCFPAFAGTTVLVVYLYCEF
jgi:hypothetical protein